MSLESSKLQVGGPIPWFEALSALNVRFRFDTVAGRYLLLCFFGSADALMSRRLLDAVEQHRSAFDDKTLAFFGVSVDPEDERCGRVREMNPGIHFIWDFDRNVSRLFAAASERGLHPMDGYQPFSLLLDERLRIVELLPLGEEPERHLDQLLSTLAALPALNHTTTGSAPVLSVPRVLEPELCRALMRHYDEHGGGESGVMRDVDGKTVGVHDHRFKRRRDQEILDDSLRTSCRVRIHDRLLPEIEKAFQFRATRIERYIVSCYDSEVRGHFRAHRDNTAQATAHRKFAVSLVLNSGDFQGGDLRFPEFGAQRHCPPAGGAIVFSCSLLHEVTPVTQGKRYAFLPFLYDEAAARIREETSRFLENKGSSA